MVDVDAILGRRLQGTPASAAPTPSPTVSQEQAAATAFDEAVAARLVPPGKTESVEQASSLKLERMPQTTDQKIDALNQLDARQTRREEARAALGGVAGLIGGGLFDSDLHRRAAGGALKAGAMTLDFAGTVYDLASDLGIKGIEAATGKELERPEGTMIGNSFRKWGEAFELGAEHLDDQVGFLAEQSALNSAPTGKWNDVGTWKLGDDPDIRGYAMHLAELGGQMTLQAPAAFTRAPLLVGALVGGSQAGGSQMKEYEDRVTNMSDEEFAAESQMFRELVSDGMPAAEARDRTMKAGSRAAAAGGFGVGSLGGAVTSYILNGFSKILSGGAVSRLGKAVVADSAFESAQEVTETVASRALSNVATGSDTDVNADTFGDAVLGALGGAGTGFIGGGVDQVGRNQKASAKGKAIRAAKQAVVDEAVETADVSPFLDRDADTYNPTAALAVVRKHVTTNGITDVSTKAAKQVSTALRKEGKGLEDLTEVEDAEGLSEFEALNEKRLAKAKEKGIKDDDPIMKSLQKNKKIAEDLRGIWAQEAEAQELMLQVNGKQPSKEDLAEATVKANEVFSEESMAAADTVVTMAMNNPDALDVEAVDTLVENTQNGLTSENRELLRATAASIRATRDFKSLEGVQMDVLEKGSDGHVGLLTHEATFRTALTSGDRKGAAKSLAALRRFAETRESKRAAMDSAFDTVVGTNNETWIARNENGMWAQIEKPTAAQQAARGALLRISDQYTPALLDAVSKEADVLAKAVTAQEAALSYKPRQAAKPSTPAPQAAAAASVEPTPSPASTSEQVPIEAYSELSAARTQARTSVPTDVDSEAGAQAPAEASTSVDEEATESSEESLLRQRQAEKGAPLTAEETEQVLADADSDVGQQALDDVLAEPPTGDALDQALKDALENALGYVSLEPNAGRVSVYDTAEEPDPKWYQKGLYRVRNHITEFFTQEDARGDKSTIRPLVAVKDFLSAERQKLVDLSDFMVKPPTDQEPERTTTLNRFFLKAGRWNNILDELMPEKGSRNPEFFWEDPIHFLLNENGKLDENVKTAISFAAYTWMAENAGRTFNTNEDINRLLGRSSDARVTPEERTEFRHRGSHEAVVLNRVGQRIVEALGFKALEQAPVEQQAKLEALLGHYAIKLLEREGVVAFNKMSRKKYESYTKPRKKRESTETIQETPIQAKQRLKRESRQTVGFIGFKRVKRKVNGKTQLEIPTEIQIEIDDIRSVVSQSSGVLGELFSADDGVRAPTLKPTDHGKKRMKGAQKEPKELGIILAGEHKKANTVRQDMLQVWQQLGSTVERIAGVKPADYRWHVSNETSGQAQSEAQIREINGFNDFVASLPEITSRFFFGRDVWRNQRVGQDTNLVNPLQSIVHRVMISMTGWETLAPEASDTQAMDDFHVAVAQNLGIDIGNQKRADVLTKVRTRIKEKAVADAVEALRASLYDDTPLNDTARTLIGDVIDKTGEGFYSLSALVNLAHVAEKTAKPKKKIWLNLTGETDGKANGPILATIALGAADAEMMAQGGFFVDESNTDYTVWRSTPGNKDLYEKGAQILTKTLQRMVNINSMFNEAVTEIYKITGKLSGLNDEVTSEARKSVKEVTTPFIYGTTPKNAARGMADVFIDKIYERFEAHANGSNEVNTDLKGTLKIINNLINLAARLDPRRPLFAEPFTAGDIDEAMAKSFSPAQEKALQAVFEDTVGGALAQTLESTFAVYLERRSVMINASTKAFDMYNAMYEGVRTAFLKKMDEQGAIEHLPTTKKGKNGEPLKGLPLHGETIAQDKAIKAKMQKAAPYLATAMSQAEKEANPETGILLAESSQQLSNKPQYSIRPSTTNAEGKNDRSNVSGLLRELKETGLSWSALSTHSSDSAASHRAIQNKTILNVHDAHFASFMAMQNTAKHLNEAVFNTLMDYSAPLVTFEMFGRTLESVAKNLESPVMQKELSKLLKDRKQGSVAEVTELWDTAIAATRDKLKAMAQMQHVSQYAYEGGSYRVTDADRARAQEMLNNLPTQMPEAIMAAAKAVDAKYPPLPEVEAEAETAESNAPSQLTDPVTPAELQAMDDYIASAPGEQWRAAAKRILATMRKLEISLKDAAAREENSDLAAQILQTVTRKNQNAPRGMTPHGMVGPSKYASDPSIAEFFDISDDKSRTASQVIRYLASSLKATTGKTRKQAFREQLLWLLESTVDPDTQITMVTPDMDPARVYGNGVDNSRGWYAAKNGYWQIFVRSPEFAASALTEEVLLHELTHAAVRRVMAEARKNPNHPAAPFVAELDRLFAKAKTVAKNRGLFDTHAEALASVDEMVAWGMTNQKFQREVLNHPDLRIRTKTKLSGFSSGVQQFIKTIMDILFSGSKQKPKDIQYNGMQALIVNVTALSQVAFNERRAGNDPAAETTTFAQNNPDPMSLDNEQLFDALADPNVPTSQADTARLKGLLKSLSTKLYGPFGALKARYDDNPAMSRTDRWAQALSTGEAHFASTLIQSNIAMNQQEAFVAEQIEATIAEALNNSMTNVSTEVINSQLRRVFLEAKATLTPADFETAFGVSADKAKEQYAFIFTATREAGGGTEALSRFAALGLAVPAFRNLLDFNTYKSPQRTKDLDWKGRLKQIFDAILDLFQGRTQVTNDLDPGKVQVMNLIDQLARIEHSRKTMLEKRNNSQLGRMEDRIKEYGDKTRTKVGDIARSDFFTQSKNNFVGAAGALTAIVAGERVEEMLTNVQEIRDKSLKKREGMLMGLVTEARGPKEWLLSLVLAANRNEQVRKNIKDGMSKMLRDSFEPGKPLTPKMMGEISQVLLRTGAAQLLGPYNLDQLRQLLKDPKALDQAIKDWEKRVDLHGKNADLYIRQAKDTAFHMVTGLVRNPNLHLNTYIMARLFNEGVTVSETDAAAVEKILDPLVALYALRETEMKDREGVVELMTQEANRPKGNGIEVTLRVYKRQIEEAKERVFDGKRALMMQGYTPELYQDGVEVKVATETEGVHLEQQGYKKRGSVTNDPADLDQRLRFMYVLDDAGLQSYQTGAVSYTGLKARGERSKAHGGVFDAVSGVRHQKNSVMNDKINARKQSQMAKRSLDRNYRPTRKTTENHQVPTFNERGEVVSYRYMMSADVKNDVMKRDNDFSKIMGAISAATFDKQSSVTQNTTVIQALHDQYQEEAATKPDSYLEVGPRATDPEMREYWRLLPDSTKREVQRIWGKSSLRVRTDHVDSIFGYRKYSLANMWEGKSKKELAEMRAEGINPADVERSIAQQWFVEIAEFFLGKQAARRVRQGEDVVQELVREAKDILVVKTGITLLGNMLSNITQLRWNGVPAVDILRHGRVALKGVLQYRQDEHELMKLKALRDSGYDQTPEIEERIIFLEDQMIKNPVAELIEAGLLPTIVDDVVVDEEGANTYKARLSDRLGQFTNKLNPVVRDIARTLYMAHDTPLYQVLSKGTQYSDFVARYTLYQHETTRRAAPLTKQEAVLSASDQFVNYDIASGRAVTYMNDMGLLFFTKYYVRIQRTILKLWRQNPAEGLILLTIENYFSDIQTLLDSTATIGNPIQGSAFELYGAADELLTVKVLEGLLTD